MRCARAVPRYACLVYAPCAPNRLRVASPPPPPAPPSQAEQRLDEIDAAQRAIDRRGLRGLRVLLDEKALSRSLRTFLQKLL